MPAFSPDGESLVFLAAGRLRVSTLGGGLPQAIQGVAGGAGGAVWLPDDMLVYATEGSRLLQRLPVSGGSPVAISVRDREDDIFVSNPSPLPDPDTVLVSTLSPTSGGAQVAALSLRDGILTEIAQGSNARFVAPSTLVFLQRRRLVAAPFDSARLELTGSPRLLELSGTHLITMPRSAGDTLAGGIGGPGLAVLPLDQPEPRTLVWIDRGGTETPTGLKLDSGDRQAYSANGAVGASLSPDGKRVALIAYENRQVIELDDIDQRRTLPAAGSAIAYVRWHRDGQQVFLIGNETGAFHSYLIAASGSAAPRQVTSVPQSIMTSVFPDGQTGLGYVISAEASRDLWVFDFDGSDTPLLQTAANERAPMLAPAGDAFAYVSDDSGEDHVYLRLYPDVGQAWRISAERATGPFWSRDGRELFYLQGSHMMAVSVDLSEGVRTGTPRQLFAIGAYEEDPFGIPMYDVADDGRFLMVRQGAGVRTWRWIENWGADLAKLIAGSCIGRSF